MFLRLFDECYNITHAKDTRSDTLGIKRLQSVQFFSDSDEFYRLLDHTTNRKCSAAAAVTSLNVEPGCRYEV